jgi:nucleoid-associated protein YgaU
VADTLTEGQKLKKGDALTSSNGAYTLTLQQDGNLVLAARGKAVWASGTDGQNVERAELQTDGNFVVYTSEKPVWHSDTKGSKDVKLVLQNDRNLVLYAKGRPAWSTKTETSEPPPAEKQVSAPKDNAAAPASTIGSAAVPEVAPAAAQEPAPAPQAPPAPPPPPPPPPAPRTYTVVSGDTLWAISERFYGDGSKYQVIADASGVANPDLIHPGQVLTIP